MPEIGEWSLVTHYPIFVGTLRRFKEILGKAPPTNKECHKIKYLSSLYDGVIIQSLLPIHVVVDFHYIAHGNLVD